MTQIQKIRRATSYKTLSKKVKNNSELKCYYCGKEVTKWGCTVDHLIPLCRGGEHDVHNLRISCKECNFEKDQMTDEEYREYKGLPSPPAFIYNPLIWEKKTNLIDKREIVFDALLPIEKINIPWLFANSSVREGKLDRAMKYYELYNEVDRVIKIDKSSGIMFDGYIGYLVAKAVGLKEIPIVYGDMSPREKFILS